MKIVLDLALSSDGFIARPDGDSSWVSERTEDLFKQRISDAGCLVVGSTTFNQYHNSIYPVSGALNIVMTRNVLASNPESDVVYASSVSEALKIAEDHHCPGILVAGGSTISKMFLQNNLIDEIYFSIHPIVLNEGMRPFGETDMPSNLQLLDSKDLGEGIRQDHYKVIK